jgi:succinate dehydrogenase / fumarate reductase flavoprotein subunit
MQGLADGYFVIPYTIGDYLARQKFTPVPGDHADVRSYEKAVVERNQRLIAADSFHVEDAATLLPEYWK